MKYVLFFLMMAAVCTSQNRATLMLSQDTRLAIIGDDKGNEAYTANLRLRSEWQGNQLTHGYFFGAPEVEYADLQLPYVRASVNFGYRHNKFSKLIDLAYSLGYGMIMRKGSRGWYSAMQPNADLFLDLKLSKRIVIFCSGQLVYRNELKIPKLLFSKHLGVKINL